MTNIQLPTNMSTLNAELKRSVRGLPLGDGVSLATTDASDVLQPPLSFLPTTLFHVVVLIF